MNKVKHYAKESDFQKDIKDELEALYPGTMVNKQDPAYRQGIPDLGVFLNDGRWALLEVKKSKKDYETNQQPNQEHYISAMSQFGFARFIYPENKEEVFNELRDYIQKAPRS